MSDIVHAGIIPNDIEYNWINIAYGYCGDASSSNVGTKEPTQVPPGTQQCTEDYLDYTSMYDDFSTACTGNNGCDFQIHNYIVSNSTITTDNKETCNTGTAKVYMQYSCTESVSNLNKKR